MKTIVLIFSLLTVHYCIAQDCETDARRKSEPWKRTEDMHATPQEKPAPGEAAKMTLNFDKMESWIRSLLLDFTGAKVGYSNYHYLGLNADQNFYKQTGINGSYSSTTRFWDYYCFANKVHTNGEAGSFVYININNVFNSDLTNEVGVHSVNGRPVFMVVEKHHTEGRVDFYDLRKMADGRDTLYASKSEFIIIRNSDKPLFIRITRKEYLQQLLKDIEASRSKEKATMTGMYNNNIKAFEAEMKAYKLDKQYTPEKEAKRRKWFEEDQAKLTKVIDKIDGDIDAALAEVNKYLQKPSDVLNRTVKSSYLTSYTGKNMVKYLEDLDRFYETRQVFTPSEMVYLNPDYFNKTLSRDVPQLIKIDLIKKGYWYMYPLATKVKSPGILTPLIAIVNPK